MTWNSACRPIGQNQTPQAWKSRESGNQFAPIAAPKKGRNAPRSQVPIRRRNRSPKLVWLGPGTRKRRTARNTNPGTKSFGREGR